ncbi:MAG: serine/threonine protein kinase [Polyangiaceae bacterium]|nr:serine/threonine protein kinase [Polyangiaceae bacterium]
MAKVKLLDPSDPRRKLDRYELIGEIATGGMATVFLARRGGVGGFQRFVAIKRLHPHLANEPEFVEMFLDEARLAALIHHPNVVPIVEVGETEAGYYLVMEYVEGDTLSRIVARTMSLGQMPPRHIVLRMVLDALAGLHAAHELRDDRGQLLGLVHRDCSPQNVLVGVDGTARITDFGVARASSRLTSTAHGKLKGKLAYMAPEQTRGDELDRRTDLFAMGIIIWEVLCGKRLFKADSEAATLQRILVEPIRPPSEVNPSIPKCFDPVVLRALDRNQDKRYQNAADLADALEAAARDAAKSSVSDVGLASPREVAAFVQAVLGQEIGAQRESVRAWLAQSDSGQPLVIGGSATGGPASPRGARRTDPNADLPATQIDPSLVRSPSATPPPAAAAASAVQPSSPPVVPHFEVAADVTMRFALEQAKPEPPPPPSSPPARASGELHAKGSDAPPPSAPAPPRVPPPAKQSQRTLIGQGPVRASAPGPAAGAPAGLPRESVTIKEGNGAGGYAPPVIEDLEDAVTIARPNTALSPSAIAPAVKTARGLFAEPLLAEARARLEANGQALGDGKAVPGSMPAKTPRMPMPADQAGVADPKIQIASDALQAGQVPAANAVPGLAIVEAVPVVQGRHPRTLVSSTGEVSAGGFTPGSMTLSAEAALRNDALDPTVVHSVQKRGYGKYIIVFAVFLLVFGTGLFLMKSQQQSGDEANAKKGTPSQTTATTKPSTEPKATAQATGTATATPSAPAPEETSSASASPTGEPSHTPPDRGGRPTGRNTGGKTSKTATPTSTPATTSTATATATGEDLTNPYR